MSDDKIGNKTGSEGLSETDKGYYEDLYNDLPKEVVDILMQTHPLMGKNDDLEATAYRARRPQRREDVEEVKEARMQQVGNEINEVSRAPQQEGDPTRYVSRRARNAESAHTSAPKGNTMNQDDYDDGIQYVSVLPRVRNQNRGGGILADRCPREASWQKRKSIRRKENPLTIWAWRKEIIAPVMRIWILRSAQSRSTSTASMTMNIMTITAEAEESCR